MNDRSLGESVIEGQISFQQFHLCFRSPSVSCDLPLVRIEIEWEKESGTVVFRDSEQAERSLITSDESVLGSPALLGLVNTRNQIENLRSASELSRRLKITGYVLAGFVLVAVLGSIALSMMTRALVARVPPEAEQEVGEALLSDLKTEHTFLEDTNLLARVESAAAPLISSLTNPPVPWKFYIMLDASPNALSLPGGHVVVTTGLMEMSQSTNELSAVLAHEIAHVRLKHGFRKVISSAGPYLIFTLCMSGGSGLAGFLGGSSGLLIGQGFSQEYELEADATGWDYLVRAGIDPRAMVSALSQIERADRKPGMKTGFGAFSSHPATSKRIRRLEAKWRSFKDKSVFETNAQRG